MGIFLPGPIPVPRLWEGAEGKHHHHRRVGLWIGCDGGCLLSRGKNWEIGLDQSFWNQQLQTAVTYFQSDIDDLITTLFLPTFDSTSINENKAEIEGLETEFQVMIFHKSITTGPEIRKRKRHAVWARQCAAQALEHQKFKSKMTL